MSYKLRRRLRGLLVVKKSHDGKYLRKWQMLNGPALDVEFHSLMCLSQA